VQATPVYGWFWRCDSRNSGQSDSFQFGTEIATRLAVRDQAAYERLTCECSESTKFVDAGLKRLPIRGVSPTEQVPREV
jgi:hypothetical protein